MGSVREIQGKHKICEDESGALTKATEVHKVVQSSLSPVHDLLKMSYLHDSTLLHHIRTRYWENVIYTNIGAIVLAVNPYDYTLPNYTDDNMPHYIREGAHVLSHGSKQLPHSWSVAHQAYCLMRTKHQNQSILVSGESGAGKTEAVKIVMSYVGELSTAAAESKERDHARAINKKVTSTSPILESFGNAKTTRNDNSSRFGKFMRMKFNNDGVLVGAHICPYLLERSRVITHSAGERGYHAFYQLICGATSEERRRMRLGDVKDYRSLNAGGSPSIPGVDDAEEYAITKEAMLVVGINETEQRSLYNVLAAVLHLTNCVFKERDGRSYLSEHDMETLDFVATNLLQIDGDLLLEELTSTTRTVAGDTFTTSLDKVRATEQRDSLCKSLYERVFLWLVDRINGLIDCDESSGTWLGLLDIFGFEHFEVNSFEQLCINLTNEQLQQHYNNYVFTRDIQECKDEGIDTQAIVFQDNQNTLDLISGAMGVLSLLDEEVQLRKGSDASFAAKLQESKKDHASYVKHRMDKMSFGVGHYAASVMYNVEGWREKNMDTLKDNLKVLVRESTDTFISTLLPAPVEQMGRKPTVARLYKGQLQDLMKVINGTNPHWIRCVKPHHCRKPRMFHGHEVMAQLRSAGVLETVRIRKIGYSVRLPFTEFIARYRAINPKRGSQADVCRAILETLDIGKQLGQVGKTKVFLKSEAWSIIEDARSKALNGYCETLQRYIHFRRSNTRVAAVLAKRKVALIQSFARSKISMKWVRLTEYKSREESLIEGARRLQECVREEERVRVAMMKLEVDHFSHLLHDLGEHMQMMVERWYRDRPMRDALEQSDFKVQEETHRISMERLEQEQLLKVLDILKEDFDIMQQRQLQRERLEDEQRMRIEEQRLDEHRQRARLVWARAMEEKRHVEEQEMAEEYRKWRKLQQVSDNINQAKSLYETETQQAARVRRQFEPESFCSSVRPTRAHSPNRSRSPAPLPAYQQTEAPPSYANPTFSRISMAGVSQASHLCSSTPNARARRTRTRSPQAPKPVKADPQASHSLGMVKKLQKMSKQVQSNPYRLITPRYSPFNSRSAHNPSHPDWAPGQDGMVAMPDGTKVHIDELPANAW
eukprot:TRINITY_DN5026_c0_g1_i1.p1 TRINITY_DN5026_c0_g1~~TRINITY_DN5026_c0_g1_i1.p1  ORF type:complete len:1168 (+),score=413.62 TRINITY_DN5026_c0_g1_i1:175-3504(+)